MLVWDYFDSANNSSLSTFVNLYPEFNPAPYAAARFLTVSTCRTTTATGRSD